MSRLPRQLARADHRPDDAQEQQRLNKVLAASGVASRRDCDELIAEGRVEVDRKVVTELGLRVDPARQEIRVDGEAISRPRLVYYAVHKPQGVVSTSRDPSGRPRVTDMLPPEAGRLFSVGRLDMSSEGLMLLTNDGELANRLAHPRYGVEKTYVVEVAGHPEPDVLAKLRRGIHLAEGSARVVSVGIKTQRKKSTVLQFVLREGRNREVRRLLAHVGHKVQRLVRVAIGRLKLGELPAGAYRPLTHQEIAALRQLAFGPRTPDGGGTPRGAAGRKRRRRAARGGASSSKAAAASPSRSLGRVVIGDAATDSGSASAKKRRRKPGKGRRA